MAGRVWMKGSANAARITEAVTTPVQAKKRGDRAQNRHVERREASVPVPRHAAPPEGAKEDQAPFGAPLPSRMRGQREGKAAPAPHQKQGR